MEYSEIDQIKQAGHLRNDPEWNALDGAVRLSVMNSDDTSFYKAYGATTVIKIVVAAAIIISLTGVSFQRNGIWRTKLPVDRCCAQDPDEITGAASELLYAAREIFRRVQEYKIARARQGKHGGLFNIGNNLEQIGMVAGAVSYYRVFCQAAPLDYPEAVKTACERVATLTHEMQPSRK
jgi:hypothetical protein